MTLEPLLYNGPECILQCMIGTQAKTGMRGSKGLGATDVSDLVRCPMNEAPLFLWARYPYSYGRGTPVLMSEVPLFL